jgi:hypothetical protein
MLKHLLPLVPLILIIACAPDISDPNVQAAVIGSLTATVWTPVPPTLTPTPEPSTSKIVEVLNSAMVGTDPLLETVDAKFIVIDARVLLNGFTKEATVISIHVDCEWVFSDSCTPESTFVKLMRAISANDKMIERVAGQIPTTVHTFEMLAFDRMKPNGVITIAWNDVLDFSHGKINGNQLGSRIFHQAASP